MQILYKVKTAKVFETVSENVSLTDDDPFVIQFMRFCSDTQLLCVAGLTCVLVFQFCKQENTIECPVSCTLTSILVILLVMHNHIPIKSTSYLLFALVLHNRVINSTFFRIQAY